jgi:hypothetical protein
MGWPLSQEYNEAIQTPADCFADPELGAGQPVVNAMGLPMPRSGNYADVYEFLGAQGNRWAVKCFTREVSHLQERYGAISDHLRKAQLPFSVDFEYLERGIRIHGHWYPILKMQWVEGQLLNEFVRGNLDKPVLLEKLSQIWVRMGQRLREAKIAHADLQHGNVILVSGSKATSLAVKLIDYDGMWVPALAREKSGEVGHPGFQHPRRLEHGTYNAEVDRFPLLAVACALRALSVAGRSLWEAFDNGDNLLFRQRDFEAPARSPLFAQLLRMPEVRDLAVALIDAARMPLEQTPRLEELVTDSISSQRIAAAKAKARSTTATVCEASSAHALSLAQTTAMDSCAANAPEPPERAVALAATEAKLQDFPAIDDLNSETKPTTVHVQAHTATVLNPVKPPATSKLPADVDKTRSPGPRRRAIPAWALLAGLAGAVALSTWILVIVLRTPENDKPKEVPSRVGKKDQASHRLVLSVEPTDPAAGQPIHVRVKITDQLGNVVTGDNSMVTLSIKDPSGGTHGDITAVAVKGVATFDGLSINKAGSGYTVAARVDDLAGSAQFSILSARIHHLVLDMQPGGAVAGQAIGVRVKVVDQFENLVTGANSNITLSIKDPSGDTFGSSSAVAADGVATFSSVCIKKAGIGYTLSATDGKLSAVCSPFNVALGHPHHLMVDMQPADRIAGQPIHVRVKIVDRFENVVTAANSKVTLSIQDASGSTLGGTTAAVNGVATFSKVSISKAGLGYTLAASDGKLTGLSSAFKIVPDSPHHLAFDRGPSDHAAGEPIHVRVKVVDQFENVVVASNSKVTLSIKDSSGGTATTTTVAAVNGVAIYSKLAIKKAGRGYTLTSHAGKLAASSSGRFNITPAAPHHLVFTRHPADAPKGQMMKPVEVHVVDQFENVVSAANCEITLSIKKPAGGKLNGTTMRQALEGVAIFSDLSVKGTGAGYALKAGGDKLLPAVSGAFNIWPALFHDQLAPGTVGNLKRHLEELDKERDREAWHDIVKQLTHTIAGLNSRLERYAVTDLQAIEAKEFLSSLSSRLDALKKQKR